MALSAVDLAAAGVLLLLNLNTPLALMHDHDCDDHPDKEGEEDDQLQDLDRNVPASLASRADALNKRIHCARHHGDDATHNNEADAVADAELCDLQAMPGHLEDAEEDDLQRGM